MFPVIHLQVKDVIFDCDTKGGGGVGCVFALLQDLFTVHIFFILPPRRKLHLLDFGRINTIVRTRC